MADQEDRPAKREKAASPTILLVATDPSVLKMLSMALQVEDGYEILTFSKSMSALQAARRIKPDLIIIHSQLLGHDALALAARFHHLEGRASVPIILTHEPAAPSYQQSDPYLVVLGQSFSLEAFYAAVHRCLSRS